MVGVKDYKEYMILDKLRGIKRVVLIGSGKGGVGKSTITALLGLRMRDLGVSVGILDADLHGSSIPFILGVSGEVGVEAVKGGFKPLDIHGIKVMSLRMFVGDRPVPLRGERKKEVLKYLLSMTLWGTLDYLLIDLPPGMGDEQLTLMKYLKGPHVVVTIPTKTSIDVSLRYFKFVNDLGFNIPVIVINNLVNSTIDDELLIKLRRVVPVGKYIIIPYCSEIEYSLSTGTIPKIVIEPIDNLIDCIR
jgi:ATP-binding protein involved in chromosome partitioning